MYSRTEGLLLSLERAKNIRRLRSFTLSIGAVYIAMQSKLSNWGITDADPCDLLIFEHFARSLLLKQLINLTRYYFGHICVRCDDAMAGAPLHVSGIKVSWQGFYAAQESPTEGISLETSDAFLSTLF